MFDAEQQSTLQASYLDKRISCGGAPVALSIWDTAGQERFHALGPIYYRDADGALLVYVKRAPAAAAAAAAATSPLPCC